MVYFVIKFSVCNKPLDEVRLLKLPTPPPSAPPPPHPK